MNRSRVRSLALLAVVTLGLTSVGLTSAVASASSTDSNDYERLTGMTTVRGAEGDAAAAEALDRRETEMAPFGDATDAVEAYLKESGWNNFSAVEVKDRSRIIIKGVGDVPDGVLKKATALADGFPIEYQKVAFTAAKYRAAVEVLLEELGEDGRQLYEVSMHGDKAISVQIMPSERSDEIESVVRSILADFPLNITRAPEDAQGPQKLATRWDDISAYSGGIHLYNSVNNCTSGFGAIRNSDNAKVMITAWHCNSPTLELGNKSDRNWKNGGTIIGSGDVALGYPFSSAGATDAMYFTPATGTFGSKIYVGTATSSATKLRKGASDPQLGKEVTGAGAYSGGSTGIITRVDYIYYGEGPGFMWTSDEGRSIGAGDSGGPFHSKHTDGTYTARGIVIGGGINSAGISYVGGPCTNGLLGRGNVCFANIFGLNIDTIEARLGVTVHPS